MLKQSSVFKAVASFALVLLVAGCGGNVAPPAKSQTQNPGTATPPAPAAKAVEIVIGHVTKTTDNFHVSALKFKEVVEAKSGGQIKVTIEPDAKLGPEKDLLTKVQAGELDAAITTNGTFTTFVPEIGLFDLPFLFENIDHVHSVLDGDVGKSLAEMTRKSGMEPIGFLDFGFRHLTNSQRSIKKPEDMKGLKIRVIPNAIYQGTWEAATGTKPITMNWTEVPDALKNNKLDGQENPVSVLVAYKLWETQKYVSKTAHVFALGTFVMSTAKFKSLTPELQKVVQDAGQAAVQESRKFTADAEESGWKTLVANGMTVTTDPDRDAFRKVTLDTVYAQFGKNIPAAWVQNVRSAAKK